MCAKFLIKKRHGSNYFLLKNMVTNRINNAIKNFNG